MKKEVISIIIALPLSLLMMFIMSGTDWQKAHAQDPFGIASAEDTSIFISPILVSVPVNGTGTSQVYLQNGPITGTLTQVRVEILFPYPYVEMDPVPVVQPLRGTLVGAPFAERVDANFNRLTFEINFGVDTIVPNSGLVQFANIIWRGAAFSSGPKLVRFDDVEVTDDTGDTDPLAPGEKITDHQIDVVRPPIRVFIDQNIVDPPPCRIEAGQTLVTRVMANNVTHVDRMGFELDFDQRFVRVKEIRPSSFFDPTPIEHVNRIDNNNGRISFDYARPIPTTTGRAIFAEIEWEGIKSGTSHQDFVPGSVRMSANGVAVPAATITPILDGCDIIVNPQHITIYFDPSDVEVDEDGAPVRQEVKLRGVRNVEEVAFQIEYDQTLVQVVNQSGQPVTKIEVGSLFSEGFLEDTNNIDNNNGFINFRVNADEPLRRDGTVAVIYWKGLREGGPKDLTFPFVELLDGPNSKINTVTREDGQIEVGPGSKTDARVLISPPNLEIRLNESGLTHIQLENIQNLTEAEVEVRFNTSIVEALQVDPSTLGGAVSNIDLGNNTGVVKFTVSGINSANRNSPVAFITWKAKAVGTTDLILQNVRLTQNSRETIPTNLFDGVIRVTQGDGPPGDCGDPGDNICGVVVPEGRAPNFGGVEIFVTSSACPAAGSGNQPPSGTPATTTDNTGLFELLGNTSYRCLFAVREGHLVAQHAQPFGNLGAIELPAGDLNNDNKINIFDLAIVGNVYQKPHTIADFNGNGVVDILDLALIARNYNRSGAVDDWR